MSVADADVELFLTGRCVTSERLGLAGFEVVAVLVSDLVVGVVFGEGDDFFVGVVFFLLGEAAEVVVEAVFLAGLLPLFELVAFVVVFVDVVGTVLAQVVVLVADALGAVVVVAFPLPVESF